MRNLPKKTQRLGFAWLCILFICLLTVTVVWRLQLVFDILGVVAGVILITALPPAIERHVERVEAWIEEGEA